MTNALSLCPRLRRSPFHDRVVAGGAQGFTVYNRMLLPTYFRSLEADYIHLTESVQLWDVAAERQVEIRGADALRLMEYVTPRRIASCPAGRCRYVVLVDESGGIVSDAIVLRLAENHFWISIADADVLLWLRGLAHGLGWNVALSEPDVSPLAVQGPRAEEVVVDAFGAWAREIRFFHFRETRIQGMPVLLARSGWSRQGGFEIYLRDSAHGARLWDLLWVAGRPYGIAPGCPNLIERIESSLLSYGNDMTRRNNPFECGLDAYCDLDKSAECMSRSALQAILARGVERRLVKLLIGGAPIHPNPTLWTVRRGLRPVGEVTSAAHSPRLRRNIALAMISSDALATSDRVEVELDTGERRDAYLAGDQWEPQQPAATDSPLQVSRRPP